MNCHEIISRVPHFLEDTLSEHEKLLFQQHLEQCERCRQWCVHARQGSQTQGQWLRITAFLNVLLIVCAVIYFMFGPVITAKVRAFLSQLQGKPVSSQSAASEELPNALEHRVQANVQLSPLHWDLSFPDRSKLDALGSRLHSQGIKVLYEDSGLVILNIDRLGIDSLVSVLAEAGGTFRGGGSLYSFKLPVFEGKFRISINLKFPQSRVSQPLAHHWHLSFQLPNRFIAKDALREAGARFLYGVPEIWVIQIPGRDFNKLKEVLQSTHGVEVDFGSETVSADSYGKIPVTISLYIAEG